MALRSTELEFRHHGASPVSSGLTNVPATANVSAKSASRLRVLLLATVFGMPYRVLRCIHGAGASVYVLGTEGAKGLKSSRFCKDFIVNERTVDGKFDESLAEKINQIIQRAAIDLVIAGDAPCTRSLIAVRDLIVAPCFPMPNLQQFDLLNNKWEFNVFCQSLGISCPTSRAFTSMQDLLRAIDAGDLTYPAIAKPLSMHAGWGVVKLEPATVREQAKTITYQPIVVQEFVEGTDICASVFCRGGEIQAFTGYQYRRGTYTSFSDKGVYEDIRKIVGQLKVDGIVNFDMRRATDGRVFFIECNPRVYWNIATTMLAGLNFISLGLPSHVRDATLQATSQSVVRFPKALALLALHAPWTLGRANWQMLKFLYIDPIPYWREQLRLDKE